MSMRDNYTFVEPSCQQLSIDSLDSCNTVPHMSMGKRLKAELESRGMKPAELCALDPDNLPLTNICSILSRGSKKSQYAPAIANALGLELLWLQTGQGPKYLTATPANISKDDAAILDAYHWLMPAEQAAFFDCAKKNKEIAEKFSNKGPPPTAPPLAARGGKK